MNDTFLLKNGDTTKEVFMSYGLLNSLCRAVGDLEGAALLALDNDLRAQMLVELLSDRDEKGNVIGDGVRPYHIPYSVDSLGDLLTWAQEHIFNFFVKAAAQTKVTADQHKKVLAALKAT